MFGLDYQSNGFGYGFGSSFGSNSFGANLSGSTFNADAFASNAFASEDGDGGGIDWEGLIPAEQIVEETGDLLSDLINKGDESARDALGLAPETSTENSDDSGDDSSGSGLPGWVPAVGIVAFIVFVLGLIEFRTR